MREPWGIYMDLSRCIGCHTCEIACRDVRGLLTSESWRKVLTIEDGEYPHPQVVHIPTVCYQCAHPGCLNACSFGAITRDPEDQRVILNAVLCSGCGACLAACAFGAIRWDQHKSKAGKCDLCYDRLQQGQNPVCVDACPLRALDIGPYSILMEKYEGTDVIPTGPDLEGMKPRVWMKQK